MSNAVLEKPEVIEKPKFVTFSDRCDKRSCGAAAQQRATKDGQDLLFCNHHGNENEILLMAAGFTVEKTDERLCTCQMCVPTAIDENGNTLVSKDEPGPEGPVPA